MRNELRRRGVDVAHLLERDGENRYAVILVDGSSGERLVLWHRGDHLDLAPDELPLEDIASARLVHVDATDEAAAMRASQAARQNEALVTTDIDSCTAGTMELIRPATHAIVSEHVPRELTGCDDLEEALRQLRRQCRATLVATLGARGAVALGEDDRFHRQPSYAVAVVDTTGAGDVFRGAFISAVLRALPLDRALRYANAAAALSCTKVGAMNGIPSLDAIKILMEE